MKQGRTISVLAAFALLLACLPLAVVVEDPFAWGVPAVLVVALVFGVSMAIRSAWSSSLAQIPSQLVAVLLFLTLYFGKDAHLWLFPSWDTFAQFGKLLGSAGEVMITEVPPVSGNEGIAFLIVLFLSQVAILTDILASMLRAPALVGFPMLALYTVPVAVLPESVPWLLFIPGAAAYLVVLMSDNIHRVRTFGQRFDGDGRSIDTWRPSPLAMTGRLMVALVIPLAIVVSALLPGGNTGLIQAWYNSGTGNGSGSGPVSNVNPVAMLEGALDTSETTVLGFVKTDSGNPGYMKMWTAEGLNDNGFFADIEPSSQSVPVSNMPQRGPHEDVESKTVKATFESTNLSGQALPLFQQPSKVDVSDDWIYDPVANTVTSTQTSTSGIEFSYEFVQHDFTPEALRSSIPVSPTSSVYQRNTEHPDSKVVDSLTQDLTEGKQNQYDKVMAVHDHFSHENGFRYDFDTGKLDDGGGNAVERFLTDTKAGFCQQYAASMAWMLRSVDIPARVSIGLTGGTNTGDKYELTNFNFHAWVEVYFEGYGWVPFDPTPASGVENPSENAWAPDQDSSDEEGSGNSDNPEESDSDSTGGDDNGNALNPDELEGVQATVYNGIQPPTVWPYWVLGGLAVIVLAASPALARSARRRRRLAVSASPSETANAAWADLLDTLQDLRINVSESTTSRQLVNRLIEQESLYGSAASGLRHLGAAHERAQYAADPPTGMTLPRALQAARLGLFETRGSGAQVRAQLLPDSVLWSWRTGMSTVTRRFNDAIVYLRLLPRRVRQRFGSRPQR